MKNMLQKAETEHLPDLAPHSHDFRSLWNYFFDFGTDITDSLQPKIDISDQKSAVLVTAEVPGIKEENLDLKITDDGYLSISGKKEHKSEKDTQNSYFSEISYGTFKRTIPLPLGLDYNMADADYDNGVLSITIPKSQTEKQKYKKINVKKKNARNKNLQN